jgi:hypothetical protein
MVVILALRSARAGLLWAYAMRRTVRARQAGKLRASRRLALNKAIAASLSPNRNLSRAAEAAIGAETSDRMLQSLKALECFVAVASEV